MKYIAVSAYCAIRKMAKNAARIRKNIITLRSIPFPPSNASSREILAQWKRLQKSAGADFEVRPSGTWLRITCRQRWRHRLRSLVADGAHFRKQIGHLHSR